MSDEPTSGDKGIDPAFLAAAGWQPEDLAWETGTEAAVERLQNEVSDTRSSGEMLSLASAHFEANDPRLAASLANHGFALRAAGQNDAAAPLFTESLLIWDRTQDWIAALAPDHRARSALYHLRLKTRYPGGYDHFSRTRYLEIGAEGRKAVLALRDRAAPCPARLARWRRERPEGFNDVRKLLSASLLVV